MFLTDVYIQRRKRLRSEVQSGLILLLGNEESPMNYPDNPYSFRQDSSFLYFFGLDFPGLAGVIDIDEQTVCVFGDDLTVDEIIWMGPQPALKDKCAEIAEVAEGKPDYAAQAQVEPLGTVSIGHHRAVPNEVDRPQEPDRHDDAVGVHTERAYSAARRSKENRAGRPEHGYDQSRYFTNRDRLNHNETT